MPLFTGKFPKEKQEEVKFNTIMKTKQDAEALLKASKSLLDRVQGDNFDFEKANKDLFELRSSINDLWKKSEISCQDMIHNAELKVLNIENILSKKYIENCKCSPDHIKEDLTEKDFCNIIVEASIDPDLSKHLRSFDGKVERRIKKGQIGNAAKWLNYISWYLRSFVKKKISSKDKKKVADAVSKYRGYAQTVSKYKLDIEAKKNIKKTFVNLNVTMKYLKNREAAIADEKNADNIKESVASITVYSLPYFTVNEMESMGIYGNHNRFIFNASNTMLTETISIKEWYKEYKLLNMGIVTERYNELYPLWVNRLEQLCEDLKESPNDNMIKQSILELGWNPEVEFNSETRKKSSDRCKKVLESYAPKVVDLNISTDNYSINEEKTKDKHMIYIVTTYTETIFGKGVKAFTNAKYSHAAFSLDPDLKNMYTFNLNKNGFTKEDITTYKQSNDNCVMSVYGIAVNHDQFTKIKEKLQFNILNASNTKYSVANLLGIAINKPIEINNAMVCSQFVDDLLKHINIDVTKKASSLVSPQDLRNAGSKNKIMIRLYEGPIKKYNADKVNLKVGKIISENYSFIDESISILEKELPFKFDEDGNLFISSINKNHNFESEYAKSHKLLLTYEKTDNYEGIKYELAKLWYMNILLEKMIFESNANERDKRNYHKARAKILNDFHKYLSMICTLEKDFNFDDYYKGTIFGSSLKIDRVTLLQTVKTTKDIVKALL